MIVYIKYPAYEGIIALESQQPQVFIFLKYMWKVSLVNNLLIGINVIDPTYELIHLLALSG